MTEQTQSDDVKIPAQAAAPAAETLAAAAPAEPAAEAVVGPASVEAAARGDDVADSAEAAPAESPAESAAEAVVEPAPVLAEATAPRPRKRLRDRRGLRAAVRWTAAVVAFAALGGATAYAVTQPERTEIPGLRTPDDGRWTYPALKLPKLPAGAPRALDGDHNRPRRHYADVRGLLLPAPAGAKVDKTFPGATGWLPTRDFLEVYEKDLRKELTGTLEQNTLRHIAARAWTMRDGTRAEVYLLQFETWGYAGDARNTLVDGTLAKAEAADYDADWDSMVLRDPELHLFVYDEVKPRGAEHVRFGYIEAGDVLALVVFTKAGSQPAVPFHQAVLLQAQLLR